MSATARKRRARAREELADDVEARPELCAADGDQFHSSPLTANSTEELYVAAMGLGPLIGHPAAGWTRVHGGLVSTLTMAAVFLIGYPMMINVKGLLATIGSNFVWTPLFPALSLLAMFWIVFLIFFAKATMITEKWQVVLLLLVPNALFIAVALAAVPAAAMPIFQILLLVGYLKLGGWLRTYFHGSPAGSRR